MKGLKLSLLGLGILLLGCAFVISEKYMLFFPGGEVVACLAGLLVMVQGYRREDSADERGDSPKEN